MASARDPLFLQRSAYNYRVVAKLREGVSVDAANARLTTLGAQLTAAYPDSNTNKSFKATRCASNWWRPCERRSSS